MTMNVTEEPFVSVVTPVYNGEAHLAECIESVLAQNYSNWEYTIVNNCSTDRSLEIARQYASRDPRIQVCSNKQFLRVIQNHNRAISLISPRSRYCKLVFADDWLFSECLSQMVALAEAHPSVGIVGAYSLRGDVVNLDGLPYSKRVLSGHDVCRWRLLGGPYIFGSATSILMRSDLVRNRVPFYNERNLHADTEVCFELLKESDFGFIHQVLTFSRVEEESLSSYSRRLNTYLPAFLYDLVHFGPVYLTSEEYDRRINEHLGNYYKSMAKRLVPPFEKGFFRLHKAKLEEVGHRLSWTKLAKTTCFLALDALLNPKRTAENLWQRFHESPPDSLVEFPNDSLRFSSSAEEESKEECPQRL